MKYYDVVVIARMQVKAENRESVRDAVNAVVGKIDAEILDIETIQDMTEEVGADSSGGDE